MPRKAKSHKQIIALDCETVDDQIVLFLAAGADGHADWILDRSGLDAERIFHWMLRFSQFLCVGYVFDFDVQQICRQLPPDHLHQLRLRGRVLWRRWRILHIPNKRFTIQCRYSGRSTTIWNVSGWTQCSFVKLITDWHIGTAEDRSFIAAMKAKRENLGAESDADLIRYTTLECKLLSVWMSHMIRLHEQSGISLRSYCGAGSTAAAMIRGKGWMPPVIPPEVRQCAEQAYYGGRSEISRIGPAGGPIYGYDINSAYPHALTQLPDLDGARWFRARKWNSHWGFWRVRWKQPQGAWGLFPVRGATLPGGRRSISLLYPLEGEGWYHSYEVAAAMQIAPEAVDVLYGWFIEDSGTRPFGWISETARERLELKAAGDARQIVLKLGLNSIYGKLAQHTGTHPLQCIAYAAAVTAHTRSMLLPHLVRHQHDILLVATDGILSLVPLNVSVGPLLGQWEMSVYPEAWILQAGVYWCGGKIRTRGIDRRGLSLEQVRQIWRQHQTKGVLHLEVRRVLSYRAACAMGRPQDSGRWIRQTRSVRFSPAPRRRPWKWQDGALLTLPAEVATFQQQLVLDEMVLAGILDEDSDFVAPDWAYDEE